MDKKIIELRIEKGETPSTCIEVLMMLPVEESMPRATHPTCKDEVS